jgi:hypothetical protein
LAAHFGNMPLRLQDQPQDLHKEPEEKRHRHAHLVAKASISRAEMKRLDIMPDDT